MRRAGLAAAATWCLPAPAAHVAALCAPLGISRTLPPGSPGVALTFDDGPHPQGTPAVLEVLARHGATATFFMVGGQVVKAPALAREGVDAGHAVAIHGHGHRNLLRLPPAVIARELD